MEIHPTAVITPGAELATEVDVGPQTIIGPHVRIGKGTKIGSKVVIEGHTVIGTNCRIYPFACIGTAPQDLLYQGEPTRLEIGNDNIIREYTTINLGTVKGGGRTVVGDGNYLMAYGHIAHDCIVGDSVIMANGASLAGHVIIEGHAILGGFVGVHQFAQIGSYAMVGGLSGVSMDIVPYARAAGFRTKLYGLNSVGLKRHGFSDETIQKIRDVYKILFRSGLMLEEALAKIQDGFGEDPHVEHILEFVERSRRGICR